ncbi:hypothetical protein FYK55_19900 [Roseiconus nitratireducens]|uniref:Uncharacterized protein n=1 Tax=Roseiconus nitratireducens TaxID=2605748 RepID=A0A5M6D227_9BACT|nr:hypothetical protein [Roseiconus nitratireducens]KAA5540660.1 hypothetical protein FYK55_19900 [Roseiconus nitratireducens]
MAKFYVQCGQLRLIQTSDSAESAALSMIDRVLSPHLWIYDDPDLNELDCRRHLMLEALLHLPTEMQISQRGFDRSDASQVSVPETIQQWHALMIGMRRLFAQAGIRRSIAVLAGAHAISQAFTPPRLPR